MTAVDPLSALRERVIREITVAPGWNKADATVLVDDLITVLTARDRMTIDRLTRALRVASHSPHDQAAPPDPESGFPVCSVCGAIQTDRAALSAVPPEAREDGAGFAVDRPSGPRTEKGHALASSLRRRLPDVEIDYDAWIRSIEDAAEAWGKFRGIEMVRAAALVPEAPGLPDETAMAYAIHAAFHWGPPLLSCMTKHRRKARQIAAALLSPEPESSPETPETQR